MKPPPPIPWPPLLIGAQVSPLIRLRDLVLTLLAWGLLLFLLKDFIYLTWDYFAEPIFNFSRAAAPDWIKIWNTFFPVLALSILLLGGICIWANSRWRILRVGSAVPTAQALPIELHARHFNLDPEALARWQQWQVVVVEFDSENRIRAVHPKALPSRSPTNDLEPMP